MRKVFKNAQVVLPDGIERVLAHQSAGVRLDSCVTCTKLASLRTFIVWEWRASGLVL